MGHSPNNSSRHLYIYMPQQLKEIANPVWGSFETHENFSTYMSKFNKAHPSVKEIGWLGIVLLYSPYHLHIYSGNINGSSNGSKVDLFPRSWHFRWCAILSVSTWQHLFLMAQPLLVLHIMVSKENFVCTSRIRHLSHWQSRPHTCRAHLPVRQRSHVPSPWDTFSGFRPFVLVVVWTCTYYSCLTKFIWTKSDK